MDYRLDTVTSQLKVFSIVRDGEKTDLALITKPEFNRGLWHTVAIIQPPLPKGRHGTVRISEEFLVGREKIASELRNCSGEIKKEALRLGELFAKWQKTDIPVHERQGQFAPVTIDGEQVGKIHLGDE